MLPSFLFLPLIVLLLWNAGSIARFTIETRPPKAQIVESAAMGQSSGNNLPDIYYIVLDAYARQDILKQVIGLDNAPFLSQLKERGFYIPACAFSNYDGTISTIASVLNYDTLENLGVESSASGAYQAPNINLIQDNAASKVFRSYGYQFVTGRGYAPFNDIQSSDLYLNYAVDQGIKDELSEKRFTSLYLNTTVFRFLVELQKNNPYRFSQLPAWLAVDQAGDPYLEEATFWYWQNNYMFDSLEKLPEKPGSFFVYAHINAPHGPYVYRADGSFRYPLDDKDEKELYADAVIYLNQRVIRLVDALIQKSDPAPIIIIQADHGIHKLTAGIDKHKILSAYYLPGSLTTPPYDTITPVNNFRLILRNYFDPEMQLLPDILWTKEINQYQAVPANCSLNR